MQLGFVIDHSRCIGCHACTVACKSENDVPLGSFRTWVKYVEEGSFPEVKRSFAVLRCNQCSSAPCVTICPVKALDKRPDGIVDIDPAACIGCKACMQGCPYDALYINEDKGVAEKCHFCAHRTEVGLAPACAVVCPTEAIIPGDFHDPRSPVSRLSQDHELTARKEEAGTGPNVLYREVTQAAVDPLATHAAGGYLWSNPMPGLDMDAERFNALQQEAEQHSDARTTYDVDHRPWWGWKVSAYLLTKALGAGAFLMLAILHFTVGIGDPMVAAGSLLLPLLGLFFLALTGALLIADLRKPRRFLYILLRPNWSSWLVRGTLVLTGYGATLLLWLLFLVGNHAAMADPRWQPARDPTGAAILVAGSLFAALTAGYTGWLFGQARGRVLWMRRGLWLHLIVEALIAGSALMLVLAPLFLFTTRRAMGVTSATLLAGLVLHALFVVLEPRLAPRNREREYERASELILSGPYARRHRWVGLFAGVVLPALLLLPPYPLCWMLAGVLALVGLWAEKDILVRAGQALPIS